MRGTIYVRVFRNGFRVRHVDDKREVNVVAASPFSTTRLLVGDFVAAEKCLREGLGKILSGGWFSVSPVVLIHPLEMIDGGLSPVEERVLRELALSAGARKSVLWVGHELSDSEALRQAEAGA